MTKFLFFKKYYTSVVLCNNMIIGWKIGANTTSAMGISIQYRFFKCKDMKFIDKSFWGLAFRRYNFYFFEKRAGKWFRQWKIHPEYNKNFNQPY